MTQDLTRRALMAAGGSAAMLALAGCAGERFSLVEAIRRLLSLSSQRAFARLLSENGFLDTAIARIDLPDALGGRRATGVLSAVLASDAFRSRLTRQVNRAAEKGAALAAPLVADAVRTIGIDDAVGLVRGGPTAATDFLKGRMGNALVTAMPTGIADGLRLFDSDVVTQALKLATGIDFAGLRDDVTVKASDAIFRAMGQEEAAIRANPAETNDPILIGVFGLLK